MNGKRFYLSGAVGLFRYTGLLLASMVLSISLGWGQYLHAGDRFPDLVMTGVENWESGTLDFRELRGKLVVLDFWTVYCAVCIQDMPKMEALQRANSDAVQVILVTSSTPEEVARLRDRSEILQSVSLPMVVGDTVLNRLFSFRTVPTHVWIDEDGVVAQVTGPYTTAETIRAHLYDKAIDLPQKNENKDFDIFSPLLKEGDGRQLQHVRQYTAVFSKIDDGIGYWGVQIDPDTRKITGNKLINQPLTRLYSYAFATDSVPFDHRASRLILEVSDPDRYIPPATLTAEREKWRSENVYCYESYLPNAGPEDLKLAMRLALQQYFRLNVSVEKREVSCRVLSLRDESVFREAIGGAEAARPRSFKQFGDAIRLAVSTLGQPMIIDFEHEGAVGIPIPDFDGCLSTFNNLLEVYGLEMKEEVRQLEMLVVRD